MAPANKSHSRSHSLLLLQKLLNLRDSSSPLTLILDSLEQSAAPVLREYVSRAKVSKTKIILLSFTTLKRPPNVDVLIKGRGKSLRALRPEILSHFPTADASIASNGDKTMPQRTLVLVDSINELATSAPQQLASFLSSIIAPTSALVGVYHTDVPIVLPRAVSEYEPHPFTVLCQLATAILRLSSLCQEVERQKARNRSLEEPEWGLQEDREGVLIGLIGEARTEDSTGVVIDMELRRRSGRAVTEKFVLFPEVTSTRQSKDTSPRLSLLSEHHAFATPEDAGTAGGVDGEGEPESTFNLDLTDKQKRDRNGIVLPYFDAQTDIGAGEGGRILYEMGREDDFDDEEDEI